jgi:hypothetical protein
MAFDVLGGVDELGRFEVLLRELRMLVHGVYLDSVPIVAFSTTILPYGFGRATGERPGDA